MIRVLLFGICGRMGRITAAELSSIEGMAIVAGVERKDHPDIGSLVENIPVISEEADPPDADVWLDFSLAGPAVEHVRRAAASGKPVVVAATGFNANEEEELNWQSKLCPLLVAPNLSAGIGVLENLAAQAAHLLPETFDTGIVDLHHSTKKDSPSGTARRIASRIAEFRPKPQIVSLRAGGAIGEHQVRFVGSDEEVILIHRAWSRRAFSSGVERAIRFIVNQKLGHYTPQDIYSTD